MKSQSAKLAYDKGYRVKWNSVYSPGGHKLKLCRYDGYPKFKIRHNGKHITVKAHQLSAWQKFGDMLMCGDFVVRHLDDNWNNIRTSNMDFGEKDSNIWDKIMNNRWRKQMRV